MTASSRGTYHLPVTVRESISTRPCPISARSYFRYPSRVGRPVLCRSISNGRGCWTCRETEAIFWWEQEMNVIFHFGYSQLREGQPAGLGPLMQNLGVAPFCDEDVRGFDVSVN